MRPRHILLFFSCVIALLTAIGELFPSDGVMLGTTHIGFASLHTLVESRQAHAPVNIATTEPANLLQQHDSVAYYRSLVERGDLRFWLPNPHYFDAF